MTEASLSANTFIETKEYRRFAEFCDACRDYRYIGLCHGVPRVGKTLSARHYARWGQWAHVQASTLSDGQLQALGTPDTLFYTPEVANTPRSIHNAIRQENLKLWQIAREPIIRAQRAALLTLSALQEQQKDQTRQYLEQTYRLIRQLPAGLLTLAHQGSKAYSDQFDLVYRREAETPNAIWQADHTLLDILVQQETGLVSFMHTGDGSPESPDPRPDKSTLPSVHAL